MYDSESISLMSLKMTSKCSVSFKQWLVGTYNTQILLLVFLGIVSLLLAGFFAYHLKLCLTNTTTNETFKWREYISLKKRLTEAKATAAARKAGMPCEPMKPLAKSKCLGVCGISSPHEEADEICMIEEVSKTFRRLCFLCRQDHFFSCKSKPKLE